MTLKQVWVDLGVRAVKASSANFKVSVLEPHSQIQVSVLRRSLGLFDL